MYYVQMSRIDRLFEIIQILRASSRAITAEQLAEQLEVSTRTVYRDIQSLQARGTPIEGEVGVGYMMQQGYNLPPLNFSVEEIESIVVGLSLLSRTGDKGLKNAANSVISKINSLNQAMERLSVSDWGIVETSATDPLLLRAAIREERVLKIQYQDLTGRLTTRRIKPLSITYYIEVMVLAAWCELRQDFRHFRVDRIRSIKSLEIHFRRQGTRLRKKLVAHSASENLSNCG